jgi:serine/threonine protein kinase
MALPLKQIGPFQIQEQLVVGDGMGVYRATDTRTQHDIVLYLLDLRIEHDPTRGQRFRQAAQQAAQLQQEHIVPLYESGEEEQYAYAATGPLTGMTLAAYLQQRTVPLTTQEVVDLVQQIATGLDAAHQQGLLHLSLTPSEIWMTAEGKAGVMGLGVPRSASPVTEQTVSGAESARIVATLSPFTAPEQAHGTEHIDQRADVYSLGAIAYLPLVVNLPSGG